MVLASKALAWALANWKQLLILVVITVAWLYVDHLRDTVKEQRLEIALLKKDLETCQNNNGTLKSAIADQNKSFKNLEEQTKNNEKKLSEAEKKANQVQAAYNSVVQKILNDPTPKGCEQTKEYLKNAAQELSNSWSSKRDKK